MGKSKIIAQGAEAIIKRKGTVVIKRRIPKEYRYPQLDERIRALRTRSEARLLQKAVKIIPVPLLKRINEEKKELEIEYLPGKKLADCLEKIKNTTIVGKQLGKHIAHLHDAHIIHGDLTTSNILYNEKKKELHYIDFGLGFNSARLEDKAVDLHVFKEALEAKHPLVHKKTYQAFLAGYKISKNASAVMQQLEKVEARGRYKTQH